MNEKEIQKILDPAISIGKELRSKLRHDFSLGMTKYVCRHGTLGEGFEKVSLGHIYSQACKETYVRAMEASRQSAMAKKAHARLLKATKEHELAHCEHERLDAEAEMELAYLDLMTAEDQAKDLMAQFEEFNQVRKELEPEFREKYPNGLEQSEQDSWIAVAHYRLMKNLRSEMSTLPLPAEIKSNIGLSNGRLDMLAELGVRSPESLEMLKDKILPLLPKEKELKDGS